VHIIIISWNVVCSRHDEDEKLLILELSSHHSFTQDGVYLNSFSLMGTYPCTGSDKILYLAQNILEQEMF
jgi:hypothetical protein